MHLTKLISWNRWPVSREVGLRRASGTGRRVLAGLVVVALAGLTGLSAATARASTPTYSHLLMPWRAKGSSSPLPLLPATLLDLERPSLKGQPAPKTFPSPSEILRQRLLDVAHRYATMTDVPYVWGGNAIGDGEACQECRACLASKRRLAPGKSRAAVCPACRDCGVDCSHLVNRIYADAGLDLPYLPTARLRYLSRSALKEHGLIDVGKDLSRAKPGDLLLQARHVVMLLTVTGPTRGDFIHVGRSVRHGRIGGIEVVRDGNLQRLAGGRLVRILRHTLLEGGTFEDAVTPPTPLPTQSLPTRLVRRDAPASATANR